MNKRHYEHTLPNIRGSLSNTYEASAALMDYAFNKLKIPCVYALIEADNLKSRRVLEKVGFHEDKPMTIDGVPHVQFKAIKPM